MTQVAASPSSESRLAESSIGQPFAGAVKLNSFQILMRRWTHLHPYNAGQVMEVSGPPDRERWKHAVEAVIAEMGLGIPRFSQNETVVHYAKAPEITIEQSDQDLESFFNDEINRPFAAGDMSIRFCVLNKPSSNGQGPTHYLAAVYDHWIGDSRAMRELMQRIFKRYQNPDASGTLSPLSLDAPPFLSLFRKHVGFFTKYAAIRESLHNFLRQRHGFRVNIAQSLDFNAHFLYRELPRGAIDKLHRFAKTHGASVNDAFVAILGQTMGEFTAAERARRRHKKFHFLRNQIGVGTIVDIRSAASKPLDNVFSLYLSSYTVLLKQAERRQPGELMQDVARCTAHIKKTFGTVKGFWALVMARFWTDRLHKWPKHQAQLFHKSVPLVAGISNVNMTKSWADQPRPSTGATPQILDYIRISPTGPLVPLVFTLTTIQDRLSMCITYRTTAFTDEAAKKIADDFIQRLAAIP